MSTVYQHQLHAHKPRRKHYWLWALLLIIFIGSIVLALNMLKPNTKINNAKAVTKSIAGTSATETFRKGNFSIALPRGWQFTSLQKDIYTIYHFKSALGGEAGNRSLDVFEDSTLPNFAINRMVPVVPTEDGKLIANSSEVSDNCTAYTTGASASASVGRQMAKWQGIEFLCDMANPLRNVVGIGSHDGLNMVKVNSLTTGSHKYFMTYTENNNKPDYNIFIAAINSFQVIQ